MIEIDFVSNYISNMIISRKENMWETKMNGFTTNKIGCFKYSITKIDLF